MTDFIKVLVELRNGAVAIEGSEKLTEVMKAVMDTGKKGKLSLSIDITPSKWTMSGGVKEVEVLAKYVIVEPAHDPAKTTFFTTKEGSLTREDPNQTAMFTQDSEAMNEPARNS